MGNDGGSINKLKTLKLNVDVKGQEYVAKDDNQVEFKNSSIWKYCKLSNLPLELPIVSDYIGNLYNKEKILEWLLCRDKLKEYNSDQIQQFQHIKSIHDIVELNGLKMLPKKNNNKLKSKSFNNIECILSGSMFGETGLNYIVNCGCVIPRKYFDMTNTKINTCPNCHKKADIEQETIIINPISNRDKIKLQERYDKLAKNNMYHDNTAKKKKRTKKQTGKESNYSNSNKRKLTINEDKVRKNADSSKRLKI